MCCTRLSGNAGRKKIAKNSPSAHHRTTLLDHIFATKARIDNRKKLLNGNISATCPHNTVNFGLLTAEISWRVWAPQLISTVSRLGSVTARHSSSGRQPNFAALNRGRHLYSAGRPSRWASAQILVIYNLHKCSASRDVIPRSTLGLRRNFATGYIVDARHIHSLHPLS